MIGSILRWALAFILVVSASTVFAYSGLGPYYVNHDSKLVHSPEHVQGQCPTNASARCRDGECSFSLHHRGTCSGHGGVAGVVAMIADEAACG